MYFPPAQMEMDQAYFEATVQDLTQYIDELTLENSRLHVQMVDIAPYPADERVVQLTKEKESLLQMLMQYQSYPYMDAETANGLNAQIEKLQIDLEAANAYIESLTEENGALQYRCRDLEDTETVPYNAVDFYRYEETQSYFEAIIAEKDIALEDAQVLIDNLKEKVRNLEGSLSTAQIYISDLKGAKEELYAKEQTIYRMHAQISKLVTIASKQGEIYSYLKAAKDKHCRELELLNLECEKLKGHEKLYSKMLSDSFYNGSRKDQRIRELEDKLRLYEQKYESLVGQKEYELQEEREKVKYADLEIKTLRADVQASRDNGSSKFTASQLFQDRPQEIGRGESSTSRAASQLRAGSRCIRKMFE